MICYIFYAYLIVFFCLFNSSCKDIKKKNLFRYIGETVSPTAEEMGVPVSNADIECKSASPTSVDNEVSPQMPPPNDNPTRCIDAGAMSLVGETPAGKTPTAWSQSPSATSPNSIIDVAGLWDNAYSLLRIRFGRLLNAYETMIDLYLAREGEEDKFERQLSTTDIMEDDFHHSDPSMRQRRMARVINIWLADHGHHKTAISTPEARVEGANRRFRHSLRPSLERTGFISLPWAAACLAVEVRLWLIWKREFECSVNLLIA